MTKRRSSSIVFQKGRKYRTNWRTINTKIQTCNSFSPSSMRRSVLGALIEGRISESDIPSYLYDSFGLRNADTFNFFEINRFVTSSRRTNRTSATKEAIKYYTSRRVTSKYGPGRALEYTLSAINSGRIG